MNSVKCSDCGLINWSSDESCKKCGALLTNSGQQLNSGLQPANEKPSGSPWKKLFFTLFVIAIAAIAVFVWRKMDRNSELATAIKSSSLFTQPMSVQATRTADAAARLNHEAATLYKVGLLIIHEEPIGTVDVIDWASNEPASAYPRSAEPDPFAPPPMLKFKKVPSGVTNRRLIPKDVDATRDWLTFEDPNDHRTGWVVPIGTRELIELTSVEGADTVTAQVQFTWYWKPNEVGQHFDYNEQARQKDPHGTPKSHPILASDFPFKGTAELSRTANGWEVKSIKWDLRMPARFSF